MQQINCSVYRMTQKQVGEIIYLANIMFRIQTIN